MDNFIISGSHFLSVLCQSAVCTTLSKIMVLIFLSSDLKKSI